MSRRANVFYEGWAMYYGRLTIATAKDGQQHRLAGVMDHLAALYKRQNGCLGQFCFYHPSEDNRVIRVGIWKDRESADHAAQVEESLALRSQVLQFSHGHPEELALEMTENSGVGLDRTILARL